MCGFLGEFVWANGNLTDTETFRLLLALSAKRGPDHSAVTANDRIQFGFNRLAILDLSENGNQPMTDEASSSVLVFNGEIYNHRQLRKDLMEKGITFSGHSDTESVLKSILHHGFNETIRQLDGMFAIAFYDGRSNSLSLARDFAGIKPLFAGIHNHGIVFASQYDQVCRHPAVKGNPIDPEVLNLYLEQHFMPAPFGLLRNTFQLEPGEIVTLDAEGKKEHLKYWEFPETMVESIIDKSEAIRWIENALSQSVYDEMLSDVPLGTFLSGGIDSPLITSFAKDYDPNLKTFSIGSDSAKHDETEDAAGYAMQLNVKNYSYRMDGNKAMEWWTKAMTALHEPLADYSILPTFVVSSLARKEVKVALSGDGGDEMFYGYERFGSVARNVRFQKWPGLIRTGLYAADKYLPGKQHFNSGLLSSRQSAGHRNLHSRIDRKLMADLEREIPGFKTPETYNVYSYPVTSNERELLHSMRKAEFYGMMQKTLRKVDLASMENSLEVRVPFLKKSFIDCSLVVDYHLSYKKDGGGKQILKDILKKRMPTEIYDRPKRGFTVPLTAWSKNQLKAPFGDMLFHHTLTDLIGKKHISHLWDAHQSGIKNQTWSLFTLYALSAWLQEIKK